jgi:nucleoside-diphosphate-sugar epimerase
METWAAVVGAKLAAGGPALVFGHGANPINFISVSDVAAVVQRALADATLHGQAIDLAGPDNLTMTQFARLLGATKTRHPTQRAPPHQRCRQTRTRVRPPRSGRRAHGHRRHDRRPTSTQTRFPDIRWHHAQEISAELQLLPNRNDMSAQPSMAEGLSNQASAGACSSAR